MGLLNTMGCRSGLDTEDPTTRTTAHCAQSTKSRASASSSLPVGRPFKAPRATKKIARRKSTAVEFSTNEGDPGRHQNRTFDANLKCSLSAFIFTNGDL